MELFSKKRLFICIMTLSEKCADALEAMREKTPLCHCITNYVSMDIMANTLLAIGASPIMVFRFHIVLF